MRAGNRQEFRVVDGAVGVDGTTSGWDHQQFRIENGLGTGSCRSKLG